LLPSAKKSRARFLPYVLVGIGLFLYFRTFIFPLTPIYQGDNAPVFLLEARRILEGEVIYRDFFEFIFPGTQILYALLFKLFGVHLWIPAAMLVALGLVLSWLMFAISARLIPAESALLPGFLFVTFAFGNALDATHHWYSTLGVTGALALLMDRRSFGRLAGAGALCGLAACFTQSRGALALLGFGVFLIWECYAGRRSWRWLAKGEGCLVSSFLAVVAPFVGYFAIKVGFGRFFYCTFTFIRKYYSFFDRNNLGVYMVDVPAYEGILEWPAVAIWLFIHAVVPLAFVLFFVKYWREATAHREEPWDRLMLVGVTGLASFLAIAPAPNWFKVCTASLPALILFVWFVRLEKPAHRAARMALWAVGLGAFFLMPVMVQTDWHRRIEGPAGSAAVLEPERYEKLAWLSLKVRPSEYFFEAGDTEVYLPLGLKNAAEVAFLTPTDYTRPEQVRRVKEALEKRRVRLVLWSVDLDLTEQIRRREDHLGPLRAYLGDHYRVVKTFSDGTQVWERTG